MLRVNWADSSKARGGLEKVDPSTFSTMDETAGDDGYEFQYTGSVGRDQNGNKRTAQQSCDQEKHER